MVVINNNDNWYILLAIVHSISKSMRFEFITFRFEEWLRKDSDIKLA